MGVEVVPGRSNGLTVPASCAGRDGFARSLCVQELQWSKCLLCERRGSFPLPAEWRGQIEVGDLRGPSVQVVACSVRQLPWAVVVFVAERMIDGRWPIIGAPGPRQAIDLAMARGRQLRPGWRLTTIDDGAMRAGNDVPILFGAAAAAIASAGT